MFISDVHEAVTLQSLQWITMEWLYTKIKLLLTVNYSIHVIEKGILKAKTIHIQGVAGNGQKKETMSFKAIQTLGWDKTEQISAALR